MPIYEYQCAHCGQKFEVRQAIGEDSSSLSCP
ncbi:MAG: zinc ribbon domain-containing protein, partial [Chloroflexi bacterium]|nr:zinc ribbon domain-containing protein [Chloroflexota bacterium]